MYRALGLRFAALLLAVVAGFAAPTSALMHGWLHEHAGHERHVRVDQHELAARSDRQAAHADTTHDDEIEQPEEHHRHGHDAVGVAVAVGERQRLAVEVSATVVVSRVELTISGDVTAPSVAISDRESLPRPTPGGPSTTRPRAPPAC